jgi:hypothetical protein
MTGALAISVGLALCLLAAYTPRRMALLQEMTATEHSRGVVLACIGTPRTHSKSEGEGQASLIMRQEQCLSCMS